jgi:hypothetical protein
MRRFMRTSGSGYEVNYKGRRITLWKARDAKERTIWCGSVEVKAASPQVTRRPFTVKRKQS